MDTFVSDAQTWATTQFATADLHDERRTKRLVLLATQIAANPSGSFPQQTESWNDLSSRSAHLPVIIPEFPPRPNRGVAAGWPVRP